MCAIAERAATFQCHADPRARGGGGLAAEAEGFCCAKQIEQRSSEERKSATTQKFRMNIPHRGLGGGESESALSVSQLAEGGKPYSPRHSVWRVVRD